MKATEYRESLSVHVKSKKISEQEVNLIGILQDFFVIHRVAIEQIYRASGCRERWVHGQMFFAGFDIDIWLGKTIGTVDFKFPSGDALEMMGEFKLCGCGDKHQHTFKGDARPFLKSKEQERLLTGKEIEAHRGKWSPLGDFCKLQDSARIHSEILHVFVLAIVTFVPNVKPPTNWGLFVHRMKFANDLAIELPDFLDGSENSPGLRIRAWKVLPPESKPGI